MSNFILKLLKMNNFVSLILLIILNGSVQCHECNFFDNMTVEVTASLDDFNRKTFPRVSGCFEPKQFTTRVEGITVNDINIGTLGDHAVHDLIHLKSLAFYKCDIRKISSNAFENLPNLQEIWITDSKLTSIPSSTFKNMTSLEIIVLDGGRISKVATDAFDAGLLELSLDANHLQEINHLWFINSTDISSLYFKSNQIKSITKRTFQFTPNLKHLDLSHNEIRFIEEGTFFHLKNMDVLDLGYNRIVQLDPNIVPNNFRIKNINLSCNFLNFLSQTLLDKITVKTMVLSGNPWECACLGQIHKWMIQWNLELKNICNLSHVPYCVYSAQATVCSDKVDVNITNAFLKVMRKEDKNCVNLS